MGGDLEGMLMAIRSELGFRAEFGLILTAFALLMARVLPVVILTPFLGGETVPQEVKMGLGVMIGLVLYPVLMDQVADLKLNAFLLVALMLKELFIGLTLAFIVGLVFDAANAAGSLIDTMSGTNQAQLMVPSMQQNASLYSAMQLQMATVLFLTLGGHHLVFAAFGESLEAVHLGEMPRFSHGTWGFFETMLRIFGDMIRIALALASPVLLATFLVDLALGMINRVAPQVQVFFVAMQIKPVVTVLIMVTSIHLIIDRIVGEFGVMFSWLKRALQLLS